MANKDWSGNSNSIWKTLGASNHTEKDRQNEDYYATDKVAIDGLNSVWEIPQNIWECACGAGDLSKRLEELGHTVYSTDLVDRGYGKGNTDFLKTTELPRDCTCILTNPPYNKALEFVNHSLELLPQGGYCVMFLKTTFLESKKRYNKLFSINPPKYMFQFVSRILCAKNGDFKTMIAGGGSAVSYAWFVFQKGYNGDTIIRWINNN